MRYRNREQWHIHDERVLAAMDAVPRERFVLPEDTYQAGVDNPLPIGFGQTISQPFIVAYMTEALRVSSRHKILEIGTGSGFQTAVLNQLSIHIYTVEKVPQLADKAAALFTELGYRGIHLRTGNGRGGWPEEAPFDRIIVTAAPVRIPDALLAQLAPGGRMIIPVGPKDGVQHLCLVKKSAAHEIQIKKLMAVRFVTLV